MTDRMWWPAAERKSMKKSNFVAMYGLLVALALILSYVEAQIPAFFAIPGMKLGLTNIVVLIALYKMNGKSALLINIVRILLVSLLFGNMMALSFSAAGGMLSWLGMVLLKKTGKFRIVTVSIAGGILHNVGQILVAILWFQTTSLGYYLLILWFTGLLTGFVIGLVSGELVKRLQKWNMQGGQG